MNRLFRDPRRSNILLEETEDLDESIEKGSGEALVRVYEGNDYYHSYRAFVQDGYYPDEYFLMYSWSFLKGMTELTCSKEMTGGLVEETLSWLARNRERLQGGVYETVVREITRMYV